jgi:diguanylate cyclase (GGDEF)-like protein/putative nucleotidyltransferase with HDIG domain/PAS domain S-box-containing protein
MTETSPDFVAGTIDTAAPVTVVAPPSASPATSIPGADISSLLRCLNEAAIESGLATVQQSNAGLDNQLIHARLGMANGLFTALRFKHPPTASHCLRVALGCSSWAASKSLDETERESIEVAALLHDVGKIGVPDLVLAKPGRLSSEEMELMAQHYVHGLEVLQNCGLPESVLEAVRYMGAWYDGSRRTYEKRGEAIPLAARMLAIVDAFDSMTTDHVYRPARSRERAIAELYAYAGSQFDPRLVREFGQLMSCNQNALYEQLAHRWLHELPQQELTFEPRISNVCSIVGGESTTGALFGQAVIEKTSDGVVFVDNRSRITFWNTGMERLTGVGSNAASGRMFVPSLFDMRDASTEPILDDQCPVARAIATGMQGVHRLRLIGRTGLHILVDMHVIPVRTSSGDSYGAAIILHDASSEASLEEQCQELHAQVVIDPLTQVANRAEFDRMLAMFVDVHQQTRMPCSLIMCDIDHFKRINDTFGHQAGDEAIKSFASVLKTMCRSGDLVARYGGEEFVVLCADCNNATAMRRAEQMRKKLNELLHVCLGNRSLSASFGVTELQPGDTPATMLRRSDRALLMAKDQGRNRVIQLGDGMNESEVKKGWWPFRSWCRGKSMITTTLVTVVPIDVAVQKLRGFIADHDAKILRTDENYVSLELSDRTIGKGRRHADRPLNFIVDLRFYQQHLERSNLQGLASGSYVQTRTEVTVRPQRERDRRRESTSEKARMLLISLKSYLMAKEGDGLGPEPRDDAEASPQIAANQETR